MYKQLEENNIILETTVKKRTQELEEQTAIAVKANRAKSDFLAVMSHEIRTPLNAVIGFSELELKNDLSEDSRDNITQIRRSGSYLLGIINDILDISKIEAGSIELVTAGYDTTAMIDDVVSLNRVRLKGKPVEFVLEIAEDFPVRLFGDELRVRQILNNLLSNAVKFTNEGEIKLSVEIIPRAETQREEEKKAEVLFSVRDTGVGIKEEDLDRLFNNYTQLDMGANRRGEGTGLGLAIAKRLAEMMGGSIRVESEYGKGSCFTARIVQGLSEMPRTAAPEMRREEEQKEVPRAGGNILVADDVPANIDLMVKMLKSYGVQTDTASSGNEALLLAEKNNYGLIFMDHMMPEMDGVETTRKLRASGYNGIIVALTASAMQGMKEFYLEQGFDDYLSKPVSEKALDEILSGRMGITRRGSFDSSGTPIAAEIEAQRLDKQKHYRLAASIRRQQILRRLKEALESKENEKAETFLSELEAVSSEAESRRLYLRLYEFILTGETEKALELLANYKS